MRRLLPPIWLSGALAFGLAACAAREPTVTGRAPQAATARPSASAALPPLESSPPAVAPPPGHAGKPCGALGCLAFDSPLSAFRHVLGRSPRVLAIGETHAQKGTEGVASATRRFTETLLPELAGRASDLIIELWVASGDCGEVEKRVQKQQAPVTETQSGANQSEFVLLGTRAKELGIQPHALTPTCDEYREIAGAGAADIARMLELMAAATERELTARLGASASRPGASLVVAYGGALHNDVAPRAGREAWSFGPALTKRVGAAYVELDLIVPEFVKDTESWRSLPWYDAYARTQHGTETLLYAPVPNAFVLVFGKSTP